MQIARVHKAVGSFRACHDPPKSDRRHTGIQRHSLAATRPVCREKPADVSCSTTARFFVHAVQAQPLSLIVCLHFPEYINIHASLVDQDRITIAHATRQALVRRLPAFRRWEISPGLLDTPSLRRPGTCVGVTTLSGRFQIVLAGGRRPSFRRLALSFSFYHRTILIIVLLFTIPS